MADTDQTIPCSRPLSKCPPIPAWGAFVVLDVPDEPQRWFCNLSCLWAWQQYRITAVPHLAGIQAGLFGPSRTEELAR